jgi:hypothetical protein
MHQVDLPLDPLTEAGRLLASARADVAAAGAELLAAGGRPPIFFDPSSVPGKPVDQPWAGLLFLASCGFPAKDIETRLTRTTLRGPLVFVATAGRNEEWAKRCAPIMIERGVPAPLVDQAFALGNGRAICVGKVVDVRPLVAEDFPRSFFWDPAEKKQRFAWMLESMRPLEPFYARPVPGFMRLERAKVAAAIRCACPLRHSDDAKACLEKLARVGTLHRMACSCMCHAELRLSAG